MTGRELLVAFRLPNGQEIDGAGFQVIPRKGELVHFLTGEAPQSVYRVEDVEYLLTTDEVRVRVILRG